MCKSMAIKAVGVSVAMTIAALLLAGAFVRQFTLGPGGLVGNYMQLASVAGMYFVGFLFLGVAKMLMCCAHGEKSQPAKRSRRR